MTHSGQSEHIVAETILSFVKFSNAGPADAI